MRVVYLDWWGVEAVELWHLLSYAPGREGEGLMVSPALFIGTTNHSLLPALW